MTSLSQKSLNNSLTRSNKKEITHWGNVDLSAKISYGTSGTALKDGFLLCRNYASSGQPDAKLVLSYNGVNNTYYLSWFSFLSIQVPKGASWTLTSGVGPSSDFFPCIGG